MYGLWGKKNKIKPGILYSSFIFALGAKTKRGKNDEDLGRERASERVWTAMGNPLLKSSAWKLPAATAAQSRRNLLLIQAAAQSHKWRNSMLAFLLSMKTIPTRRHSANICRVGETWQRRRQPVIPAKLESTVWHEVRKDFSAQPTGTFHSRLILPKSKTSAEWCQTHHFQWKCPHSAAQTTTPGPSSRTRCSPNSAIAQSKSTRK